MPLLMKILLTISVFVGLPVASYFAGKAYAPDPVASERPDGPGVHRAASARPTEHETAATAGVAQPTVGSTTAPRRTRPHHPKAHRTAGRVATAAAPTPAPSASAAPADAPTPAEAPSSSAPTTSTDSPAPEPSQSPTPAESSPPAPEGSATPSPAA